MKLLNRLIFLLIALGVCGALGAPCVLATPDSQGILVAPYLLAAGLCICGGWVLWAHIPSTVAGYELFLPFIPVQG